MAKQLAVKSWRPRCRILYQMGPDRIDIIRMHTMEQLSGYMYGGINQFSARMHANRSLRDVCFEHDKR